MKGLFAATLALAVALTLAVPAFSADEDRQDMTGSGYMGGGMGPGMMHGGKGMHGHGPMGCRSPQGWTSMTPEQQNQCEKMYGEFLKDTLKLRQKLRTTQMELQTLWAQPDVDETAIEKLSDEAAQLQAELSKKRDKHLMRCRKTFGGPDWTCPGCWR
jgi:Spy/CpxP family protein refolding chaperone